MTKSVCGGVRSSTLDSLAMRCYKKRKHEIFHEKCFFSWKTQTDEIFQKKWKYSKVTFSKKWFFLENWLLRKKWLLKIFIFWKNVIGFFRFFLFLWYIIPKLSNAELLTPPHTLLVTVYVSGIFSKIRKIPKIRKSVQITTGFSLI